MLTKNFEPFENFDIQYVDRNYKISSIWGMLLGIVVNSGILFFYSLNQDENQNKKIQNKELK